MPLEAIDGFMRAPFNLAADAKMLLFFQGLTAFAGAIIGLLVVLSVVVKHFWCRYLCPYGALLGVASLFSPQRVVRDAATCNDCQACTRACPAQIPVHRRASVWTAECTGCMSCVAACTVPDCLTSTRRGKKGLSPWLVPATALATMLGFYGIARLTGFWETDGARRRAGAGLPDRSLPRSLTASSSAPRHRRRGCAPPPRCRPSGSEHEQEVCA